ncbi:MAG: SufE family protein [Chitinophagaceae bacterium]
MENQKSIAETENEIIEDFKLLDAWDEDQKYEYIIDMGKKLPELDDIHKTAENVIKGCQSTVWLAADFIDDKVYFKADSNSVITKGLISMLIQVLSGRTTDEIIAARLDFINKIGMHSHLAQTRSNGLLAMVKQMKNYALAYKIKNTSKA